jgi:phosphoribosylformylglycinamidine cyclo-ligase
MYSQDHMDNFSKLFFEVSKDTWSKDIVFGSSLEPDNPHFGFMGPRGEDLEGTGTLYGMCADGVGTKTLLAARLENIGFDLMAMVCDDAAMIGATPIMCTTTVDVGNIDHYNKEFVSQIALSIRNAARCARVSVINGECASIPSLLTKNTDFPVIINASLLWKSEKQPITGTKVKPGHGIFALYEPGFRSNGFTLLNELMTKLHPEAWWDVPSSNTIYEWDTTLGQECLRGSQIYSPFIMNLIRNDCPISGMVHITGGGFVGKLRKYLQRSGLSAVINNPYPIPSVVQYLLDNNVVSFKEAYSTWSMGMGFLIITPEIAEVQKFFEGNSVQYRYIGYIGDPDKDCSITLNPSLTF